MRARRSDREQRDREGDREIKKERKRKGNRESFVKESHGKEILLSQL